LRPTDPTPGPAPDAGRNPTSLTDDDLELLHGASRAGADQAGRALAQLTGIPMQLSVSRVAALSLDEVPDLLGGVEAAVVALHLAVYGDGRGNILIAFETSSAGALLDAMVPGRAGASLLFPRAMSEMEQSGLLELGNILAAAYLNAVSHRLRRSLLPSVPCLAVDMAGAVTDYLLIEMTSGAASTLVLQTELQDQDGAVIGSILMLPDPASLPGMLEALRRGAAGGA